MMLLIPHRNPIESVNYLLENTSVKYLSKQVLELMQLICSAGYSNVYKKIPQGKDIQNWIKSTPENEVFVWHYINYVFNLDVLNLKEETINKYIDIFQDYTNSIKGNVWVNNSSIKTAIFRYKKEYKSYTQFDTNTEIPIEIAEKEYQKYITWKINKI